MEEEILAAETAQAAPEEPAAGERPATVEVVDIQFRPGQKVYYFDPAGLQLNPGDHVIIDTARGPEFGFCAGGNHPVAVRDVVTPLRQVLRLADARDERIHSDNEAKERKAFAICQQKIADFGLDMQLVSAECAFDGSKILFFFTAEQRVDFRELVKSLAYCFHTRIELRQIGVRDKARMVGGLGICGRPFCCSSFLTDFQPVSIKMAKTQNLSLNPTKISGTCGRLMCCLKYEQDAYEDLLRTSPKAESFVDTPEGRGTVVEVNLLRQQVRVRLETQPDVIHTFANTDIAVLRNGKARKNDPPIPADLAPISGGKGKRPEPAPEEAPVVLEPIRLRYSTEQIAEEAVIVPAAEPAPEKRPQNRRRNPDSPKGAPRPPRDRAPRAEKQNVGPRPDRMPRAEKQPRTEQKKPRRPANRRPRKPRPEDGGNKGE